MSQLTIDVLSTKSIERAIKTLEQKKKDLQNQCKLFCEKLSEIGIQAAMESTQGNNLAKHIFFFKEINSDSEDGCEAIVFGKDITSIVGDGVDAQEISPILMLEFGSGQFALPPQSIVDGHIEVGRGSFPSPTAKFNANNPNGWYYLSTKDQKWHHSFGISPCQPMQNAHDRMFAQIETIANEVFRI